MDYSGREANRHSRYPKVSIVILNWNGLKDTVECVESLKKITYPNYEVIVVDNTSQGDEASNLRRRYGNYLQVIESARYYTIQEAKNIGIKHALRKEANYLLFLDNDIVVAPDFLSELVNAAESDSKVGIVGSKIYSYFHPRKLSGVGGFINFWTGFHHDLGMGKVDTGQLEEITDMDYVTPSCILVSANAVLYAGMWDEKIKLWFDDVDFCTRVHRAGFRVAFASGSKVWHKERALYLNLSKSRVKLTSYGHFRDRFRCMRKYCNKPQLITSTLLFFIVEAPSLVVRYLWRRYYSSQKERS